MKSESIVDIVDKLVSKVHIHMTMNRPYWTFDKTLLWFSTENPLLGGLTPEYMIFTGRHKKLEKFIDNCIEGNFP